MRNSQEVWQDEEEEERREEGGAGAGGAVNQVVRFQASRRFFSVKPIVPTKAETHTHFGTWIPPPPIPPPPPPPPPTPAAFAPADAEALRTSRYCISAAAALE